MKKLFTLLLAVCLVFGMAACGASASDKYVEIPGDNGYEGIYEENAAETQAAADSPEQALPENRKLIRTVEMDAETKDLPSLLKDLEIQIASMGGYLQQKNIYNGSGTDEYRYRSADLVIRIPADQADAFIRRVEDDSNLVSVQESVDDVTLDYVATDSRKKALETEEARLLELMEGAENMSDLLEIEARLTEVRCELESIVSQLRTYDNLVDYATVRLHINQVRELSEPEPETFWDRISTGFIASLKGVGELLVNVLVWLIVALPYLIPIAVIVILVIVIRKLWRKKHPKKPRKPAPGFQTPPDPPQNP